MKAFVQSFKIVPWLGKEVEGVSVLHCPYMWPVADIVGTAIEISLDFEIGVLYLADDPPSVPFIRHVFEQIDDGEDGTCRILARRFSGFPVQLPVGMVANDCNANDVGQVIFQTDWPFDLDDEDLAPWRELAKRTSCAVLIAHRKQEDGGRKALGAQLN